MQQNDESLGQDLTNERLVVDVAIITDLNALHEFVHLLIAQLLAQAGKNVAQFSCTDIAITFLVKDLEATNEFL